MNFSDLASSYLEKAVVRFKVLDLLLAEGAWSDVAREAQEAVELALKAVLRQAGVEPPKWHDVSGPLLEFEARFSPSMRADLERLADISRWLRKEREFAFDGDVDFVPSERYSSDDAARAAGDAGFLVAVVAREMGRPSA